MPISAAPAPAPADLPSGLPLDELLRGVLAISLTGLVYYLPVYDPGDSGEVVDFAFDYLNPAAQRMLRLPARSPGTYLDTFPDSRRNGGLAFHRDTFRSGQPGAFELNYQADGYDNYFRVAGRRLGPGLLVSFTDTADQPRSPVEQTLRESQAAEKAARAEAEHQRGELQGLFEQSPVALALFRGPNYVIEQANEPMAAIWGGPLAQVLGQPVFSALPYVQNQGFEALLADVLAQGTPYDLREQPVSLDRAHLGQPALGYFNLTYRPQRDAQGHITGIISSAHEVTEQVLARQQAEQLNQELEARVAERTTELQAALRTAEQQREQLSSQQLQFSQILGQAPAMIATLEGPDHRFAFTNPRYDALVGNRARLGVPVAECLPEVVAQGFVGLLDGVYRTGQPHVGHETPIAFQPPGGEPVTHYLDFTYQALRDGQGQPTGILAFIIDVTDQVRARQQNEALQAELLATAQRQVQEREAFYQVFEQTPAPVALLRTPAHRFEYVNAAYQAFFPTPLAGLEAAVAAPELVAQGFGALLDRVYHTGETFYGDELPFTPEPAPGQTPQTRYFSFTYQAYREAGAIVGVSIFAFDVTDQVRARQERETQRQQLQAVFAQAPVAVCVFQGEDAVLDVVNPPMAEMLGHPLGALVGRPLFEVLPELQSQGLPALLAEVRRTGTPFVAQEQEIQLARHRPGEPGYFNYVYQPLLADDGVSGIVCVATDVTEQVLARQRVEQLNQELEARVAERTRQLTAQQALLQQLNQELEIRVEERTRQLSGQQLLLRQILSNVPAYIATLSGPEHRYTFFNELYHAFSADRTALGLTVAEVYPEVVPQGFIGLLDRVYATGKPCVGTDTPAQLLNKATGEPEQLYVDFIYQPLFDEEHRVHGILVYIIDVTDKVRVRQQAEQSQQQVYDLNQELAAINEELTATNEELGDSNQQLVRTNVDLDNFIYTASHDLKAPISNLEGLLYLLRDELPADVVLADNVAPTLDFMSDAVERFKRTIDHLTEVTKLQKEHTRATTAVNLAAVVEDVRLDLLPLLQETNAQFTVHLPDFPPVLFPEKNLRSVVYNLLSNALKYRHPDRRPHVDLRGHVQPGFTVVEVHDNGLGLDAHHLPKLFGMFQRFHSHVEGTGIGLYMVKRMVENAGGRIEVHSQLGAGTTFLVYLPHLPIV